MNRKIGNCKPKIKLLDVAGIVVVFFGRVYKFMLRKRIGFYVRIEYPHLETCS